VITGVIGMNAGARSVPRPRDRSPPAPEQAPRSPPRRTGSVGEAGRACNQAEPLPFDIGPRGALTVRRGADVEGR
jgi:hypothetical protein